LCPGRSGSMSRCRDRSEAVRPAPRSEGTSPQAI
jgi:hypothetical protein